MGQIGFEFLTSVAVLVFALLAEGFKRPSKKSLRKERIAQGPKMFESAEVRAMLAKAGQPLKAMILLGINCGFGNNDCATLPLKAV